MTASSSGPHHAPATPAVSRVDRFYISRELGRGSTGIVYCAHDPIIDRSLALKVFHAGATPLEARQSEQKFLAEARAVGRLAHPNIVTAYDACSENGVTFIAMELLQGEELSQLLDRSHPFSIDEVASIVWKIADALNYAHKCGVIHCDIKPANIFMIEQQQPKLVDFGIARISARASATALPADAGATLFGAPLPNQQLLGTPNYMSPEQALGQEVDFRTDIYSLGAVMYELLTQRKPFQADGTEKLVQQIAYKAPPAPHEVNPEVPLVLSQIVMKAMSKRPDRRYLNAEEMALHIKRYLAREKRARQRTLAAVTASSASGAATAAQGPNEPSRSYWLGYLALMIALGVLAILCLRWLESRV